MPVQLRTADGELLAELDITPREISRQSLDCISSDRLSWDQTYWHGVATAQYIRRVTYSADTRENDCKTAHCWAGWCEFNLTKHLSEQHSKQFESIFQENKQIVAKIAESNKTAIITDPEKKVFGLLYNTQEVLDLEDEEWSDITSSLNSFNMLVQLHNEYFDDNYPLAVKDFYSFGNPAC
jgi:hypothetical protein